MKYFWWRFLDYITGALVGGVIVFFVNKFVCHQCIGQYTPVLMLGLWIGFMLLCNFIFQKAIPSSIKQDTV
jgi:F0F1-type ATP synthase assembly protein I